MSAATSSRSTSDPAHDVYLICELPDNKAAAAIAVTVGAAGGAVTRTVVLLTPAEMDHAIEQAADYRAPGA